MLHRATTKREEAEINAVILAGEAGVVAHGFGFGEAGEANGAVAL